MKSTAQEFAERRLEFEAVARSWNIGEDAIQSVFSFLEPLREYHTPTAAHCLRVGILAGRISERGGRPTYLGALGGALHDVGKIACPVVLLNAHTMSPEDYELIKPHVRIGYEMLRERLPEIAEVMKHHHLFQPNPYPDLTTLPPPRVPFYRRREELYARIGRDIAIADFVDAMKTRDTDKFGGSLSTEQKYACLREAHETIIDELEALIADGIVRF